MMPESYRSSTSRDLMRDHFLALVADDEPEAQQGDLDAAKTPMPATPMPGTPMPKMPMSEFFLAALQHVHLLSGGNQAVEECFARCDRDGSGVIDEAEFSMAMDQIGFGQLDVFSIFDPDDTKTITLKEARSVAGRSAATRPGERAQELVRPVFDALAEESASVYAEQQKRREMSFGVGVVDSKLADVLQVCGESQV